MRATLALVLIAATAGCGGSSRPAAPRPTPAPAHPRKKPAPAAPQRIRCPAESSNCGSARGRVVYVEAVDPDGDGDAHFVLASEDSITGPGIAAIDVEKYLRPRRLPRIGDWVSAAGPVYRGSHGQRQIQAVKLRIRTVP